MDQNEIENSIERLWSSIDDYEPEAFRDRITELVEKLPPNSPIGFFELACAYDSTGHSDKAVPLYRQALAGELTGIRRRRATIQLASSLRNLGESHEGVTLLQAERERASDELDDAVIAFLSLALVDTDRGREATALALGALARHLPRYNRSLANYAKALVEDQ